MIDSIFGLIGTGNMGGALARAIRKKVPGDRILLANRTPSKAKRLAAELDGCAVDTLTAAKQAKYVFLGVKPQMMPQLLREIESVLAARTDRFVLVTMAAGLDMAFYARQLGREYPLIRIMPNTPAAVGKGMILYTANSLVFMDEITEFCEAMQGAGRLDRIEEARMDAGSAVSGCGPAFVCLFAEAMADAGVACGLTRQQALTYAAQTLAGTAELILAADRHPAQLKDEVCSPGGSTIDGVQALEQSAFRGTVMNAVLASYQKTLALGGKKSE